MDLGKTLKTTDGGESWFSLNHNVESSSSGAGHMLSIAMLDDQTTYLAGNDGGVIRYRVTDSSASIPEYLWRPITINAPVVNIVPNPVRDEVGISLSRAGKDLQISRWMLLDLHGRTVLESDVTRHSQGNGSVVYISLGGLPVGYYVLQVFDGSERAFSAPLIIGPE